MRDFETFYLPIGMKLASIIMQAVGGCTAKGWGLCEFLNLLKEKDMRELSTEELDVVVGGMPIIIQ